LDKLFTKYLIEKPHQYLQVWSFLYAYADNEGNSSHQYYFICSRFKISRATLQRIIECGITWWAESGQNLGRKWADKQLTIIFNTKTSEQKVGRKWAESGQKNEQKEIPLESIEVSPETRPKSKSQKIYPRMIEAYDNFCQLRFGMGAKMNSHQGKAMKNIIEYLATQVKKKKSDLNADELQDEVLSAWEYILKNWGVIQGYYAEQIKLSQIDCNLPNILIQLRKNKQNARDQKYASTIDQIGGIDFSEND